MDSQLDWNKVRKAKAKAIGSAVKFKSKYPSCSITMLATNITGYKLRFPKWFSQNIKEKRGSLILQEGDQVWKPTYFTDNSRISISKGWMKFVKDNDLRVADVCGFEMIPGTVPVTLKVTIFRTSDGDPSDSEQSAQPNTQRPSSASQRHVSSSTTNVGVYKPERPHFVKVILKESLKRQTMLIPPKFVMDYGHDIAKDVQVKDPSGRKWKLDWSKADGQTWFTNGWKEFVDYYSIAHGHVLSFQYEGNSRFSVVISDRSGTEISYPIANDVEEIQTDEEESEADGFFEVRKKKSRIDEVNKALAEAENFDSNYPFFSMVMQQSSIVPISARMFIPSGFYCEFIHKEFGLAKLNSNGDSWNVKFSNGGRRGPNKKAKKGKQKIGRPTFGAGWKQFSEENYLEAGDVCIFELTSKKQVEFEVHIYRANEKTDPSPTTRKRKQDTNEEDVNKKPRTRGAQLKEPKTEPVKEPKTESEDILNAENPSFRVFMEPRHVNGPYLDIPMEFAAQHCKQVRMEATLMVGTRRWRVQFWPPGRFCSGWYKFAQGNSLHKRDVCVFEMIDKGNMVMKVHLLRGR